MTTLNKAAVFLISLAVLLACENPSNTVYLPTSIGGIDEVLVVMDERAMNGETGDTLNKYLTIDYPVLPQPEPVLNISVKPHKTFTGILKKYRSILFAVSLEGNNEMSKMMRKALGNNLDKALSDPEFYYATSNDIWAKPQQVLYLFAPTSDELIRVIGRNHQQMIDLIQQSENRQIIHKQFAQGKNMKATRSLSDEHMDMKIPSSFKVAIQEENFLWLRHETPESSTNIMVNYEPLNEAREGFMKQGIYKRDSLGKMYVEGKLEGSYMVSDTVLPFQRKKVTLNGLPAYEHRGLWRLHQDFLGGPFLNYYILDTVNQRTILLDGFVFAPKLKKKKFLRQLEALFSTFTISNSELEQ